MDTGGLAQMTYNQFSSNMNNGNFSASSGFASRGNKVHNSKRLSVALPPRVDPISEFGDPTPRTTSRSHLLAGLRTAPKSATFQPTSAPYSQTNYQLSSPVDTVWNGLSDYNPYSNNISARQQQQQQYNSLQAAVQQQQQQSYASPQQVLSPPAQMYQNADEMDPAVYEQLQLTGMFLAQRQQQLQQQLANITMANNQAQGLYSGAYKRHMSTSSVNLGQQANESGLYLVQDAMTGQYQYIQAPIQQPTQIRPTGLGRSQTMQNLSIPSPVDSQSSYRKDSSPTGYGNSNVSPASSSSRSGLDHVQPLPPPSANAFRRGHQKKTPSLSLTTNGNMLSDGPKTASAATFGSTRLFSPPTPMTGTFGPGAARAGDHPIRQPHGPPAMEELIALPTAKHEGSKNFAARRRKRALNNLVRAGSVRRGASNPLSATTPTSESGTSLAGSEEEEPGVYRRQTPIGSERSMKRGTSGSSVDCSMAGSAVHTPLTEENNAFDMQSFLKQLPLHVNQQGQDGRKKMVGLLSAAEKRKSGFI